MTDIEVLRENVIKAARAAWCDEWDDSGLDALDEAIIALDAALAPDPWALLEESLNWISTMQGVSHHALESRLSAALKWREQNP